MRGFLARSPLEYPARAPVLNLTHPAIIGLRLAAVARANNSMVDLLSGFSSTWSLGASEVGSLGPVVHPTSTVSLGYTFPSPFGQEAMTKGVSLAAIFQPRAMTHGQGLINTNQDNTQGANAIKLSTSNTGTMFYGVGGSSVLFGPATMIPGRNYAAFSATHPTTVTTPRVILGLVDLVTGQKWFQTYTNGSVVTSATNYSVSTYIGGTPDQGRVAAAAIVARALSIGEMTAWMDDPWSLWYDDSTSRIIKRIASHSPHAVAGPSHFSFIGQGATVAITAGSATITKTSVGTPTHNTLSANPGAITDTPGAASLVYTPGQAVVVPPPPVTTAPTPTPFGQLTQPPGTSIIPTTLVQAINEMLAAVGRGPITSVTDPTNIGGEEEKALAILNDACIQVQSKGWWFNSEYEYVLTPNPLDGTIPLPINCLTVRRTTRHFPKQFRPQYDRHRTFTMRGVNGKMYLYDMANQTFSWAVNTAQLPVAQPLVTGALAVDMVLAYPFEDIPQPIRWFIMCKAGRDFAVGRVPDMNTYRFGDAMLTDAEAEAMAFDREQRPLEPEANPHFARMRER